MKLKETIKSVTRQHLESGGLFFGQCVTAVGWIGGTVPEMTEEEGIIELPTSDSSNSAIVCGAALAGRKPIYAIRYQGFITYNGATLFNYAAKSLEMWGIKCPVFVRAIGMEGSIGPVASGMFHSLAMHYPGMAVVCPMTSKEWLGAWDFFIENELPVYCSEHRASFDIEDELEDFIPDRSDDPDVTILLVGKARLEADALVELCKQDGLSVFVFHIAWLKPLRLKPEIISALSDSKFGVVVDSGHTICGSAEHLSNQLMLQTGKSVHSIGLEDRTAGFSVDGDNITPTPEKILSYLKERL